jgi:N-acetyl-gamma-glutamyl-phosphate reductase
MTTRTRVAVIAATGYVGGELARLLARHPAVELVEVTGRSAAGEPFGTSFPHLRDIPLTVLEEIERAEVCFSALPHHASAAAIPSLLDSGRKVIDISADYRIHDQESYEAWYGPHPAPELLPEAVYGLPELHRTAVRSARVIANPGCYPTASILGLAPIVGCIEPDVIVDAKSGISGAGRGFNLSVNHFCEINESCQAYGLDGHRHQPEIAQELDEERRRAGVMTPIELTFVPHLVPMTRGIMATCYARLTEPMSAAQVMERYQDFYEDEPFVRVVENPPATKHTWGSNFCFVCPRVSPQTGRLVVTSCLDNLVKGAAGQAIQNMNLMLGHPEELGIEALPTYP